MPKTLKWKVLFKGKCNLCWQEIKMQFILLIQIAHFFLYIVIILATVETLLCYFQICPVHPYPKCFCEGRCSCLIQCLYDFWSFQQIVLFCGI